MNVHSQKMCWIKLVLMASCLCVAETSVADEAELVVGSYTCIDNVEVSRADTQKFFWSGTAFQGDFPSLSCSGHTPQNCAVETAEIRSRLDPMICEVGLMIITVVNVGNQFDRTTWSFNFVCEANRRALLKEVGEDCKAIL